jgi:uncharacterized membrane protein YheB (UPF0754 family)
MLEFLQSHTDLLIYLTIPFTSAIVGWGTNWLALKMTFYPLEFIGIKPIFGWQGIIPSKSGVMAGKATDMITTKLITIKDQFSRIEPARVAEEMTPALIRLGHQIVDEAMEEQVPLFWETTPGLLKDRVYQKAAEDMPVVVERLMEDLKLNITELFDVRTMVVEQLEENKDLLNEIFLVSGKKEFKFIERSGLYFGFLFGLIMMPVWFFVKEWWVLPLAGLIIGWATNWLALRLIFEPKEPLRIGFWTFQGLFIKRQKEVSEAYSEIVADRILTASNIFETIITGPASDQLISLVNEHVKKAVDHTAGYSKPFFVLTQGSHKYIKIKQMVSDRFIEELPRSIKHMFGYAEEALNMEETLRDKMQALTPREFEGFLRPVFQEDEWKLILVGAVLGFFSGVAQLLLVFS